MNKPTKVILLFFIVLSFIIAVSGAYSFYVNLHKADNCTEEVKGICSDIKVSRHDRNSSNKHRGDSYYKYTPVFSYEYNGKKYEREYGIHYSEEDKDTFREGKEYVLYVNPQKPWQFIVDGHEEDIDTFAIIGPIVGIFMFFMFVFIYLVVKKKC